jgi:hypothetical protein
MDQSRKQNQDVPNRASSREKAEGSRENMRNRESGGGDLGTSSDRAMFEERGSSEETSRSSSRSMPSERGSGASGERNRSSSSGSSSSERSSSNSGGITNRGLDREEREQQQLPERGRSQSER